MKEWSDQEALVAPDGRRFTYAEVREGVLTMATALWSHGIRPGQTVGVFAYNPPESIFLQLGAHMMGARTAWTTTTEPLSFRSDFLRMAEIAAFVYDARGDAAVSGQALAEVAAPVPVFCFGPDGAGPDLTAQPATTSLPFDPTAVTVEPSTLVQTGGTTGYPKLVHHRHSFFAMLLAWAESYVASGAPPLRHLLQSGTWHISSQVGAFMTLFSGGTLFLKEGIDNGPYLALIRDERINSGFLAPPGLYTLIDDHELIDSADLSSLRMLTVSGSAAAPARLQAAAERLGPVIRIVYGMSESPMIAAMPDVAYDPAHPDRLASCGLPFGDNRIEIRDEDGKPLPSDEVGDIWVSSSLNMSEYYGSPDVTESVLVDGWLKTGDMGRLDDDGYLYIVDRAKDMIITGIGSSNVFCRPVEDVLMAHPSVRAAALVGVPDPLLGETVHAYIVAAPGSGLTAEELREHAFSRLNARWTPTSFDFIEAMPVTASGKIDKKQLRERYAAGKRTAESGTA